MGRKIETKYTQRAKQARLDLVATGATALYIRVSTDKQADEGFSLEAQQERLEAHCKAQGWTVTPEHIYVDAGVSGKSAERRQEFQRMLQAAKDGRVVRIVAMKLDRIARNVREFLATVDELNRVGCSLVLVKESFDTSTPHGKFALTMFAAMAELEASTITERVMTGKQQKASKGGYNGSRIPFGYTYDDGVFRIAPDQANVVSRIFEQFNECNSLNAIATSLNADGLASPSGANWFHTTVRGILANGMYAGLAQWDGVESDQGYAPAIIGKDTYEKAAAKLATLTKGNPNFGKQ